MNKTINAGEGWRLLSEGELIKAGDEFCATDERWFPMHESWIGMKWSADANNPYRRRMPEPPVWYTENELFFYLTRNVRGGMGEPHPIVDEETAKAIAADYAKHLQGAYEKGYVMGQRSVAP